MCVRVCVCVCVVACVQLHVCRMEDAKPWYVDCLFGCEVYFGDEVNDVRNKLSVFFPLEYLGLNYRGSMQICLCLGMCAFDANLHRRLGAESV